MKLFDLINDINKPDEKILKEAQDKINNKLKPPGSLGKLEDIAVRLCLIQNKLNPETEKKLMLVFAGDHGITMEGVSAYPSGITPQMVYSFLNKKAAINVLCKQNNIDIKIIDMGVNHDFLINNDIFYNKKINKGTKNFLLEKAMTKDEAILSIQNGIDVFFDVYNKDKIDLIGVGDMGIGNTSSSSGIISVITGISPDETVGRGTGLDDDKLKNKIQVIKKSLKKHSPDKNDPIDILSKIGGFEIGGITGAILASAYKKIPVVIDGIISTAACLLAYKFNKNIIHFIFASHASVEKGQSYALDYMNLNPLLDLQMRLGEGTGAALAMNIIDASSKIMNDMGSFDDIILK